MILQSADGPQDGFDPFVRSSHSERRDDQAVERKPVAQLEFVGILRRDYLAGRQTNLPDWEVRVRFEHEAPRKVRVDDDTGSQVEDTLIQRELHRLGFP